VTARLASAALALALAVALAGCETTQEKSARIEKAELARQAREPKKSTRLVIAVPSRRARVLSSTIVHGSEGYAAVVTVQNSSGIAVRDLPIALTALDAAGASVYSNTGGGLAHSLVSVPYLPPHGVLRWIDDQIQASSPPVSLRVKLGEGTTVAGAAPAIVVSGEKLFEDPANGTGVEGMVANRSTVAQSELVLYAVALRGTAIVAAGRALLPQLGSSASLRFQAYLVGSPSGARLQVAAPPSTFH
jgi:hypothetical protein